AYEGQFTALFCGNDETAVGAIFKMHELGVRVPQDISIVGYDNANLAAHTFPKLTTITNPMSEIARNAANSIRNLCYKQKNAVRNSFQPKLIERASVRPIQDGRKRRTRVGGLAGGR